MAEPLYPTPARLLLLEDVAAGRIIDDEDAVPMLHHDEGTSRVAEAIWLMMRAGWVELERADNVWSLTIVGRDVLEGRNG